MSADVVICECFARDGLQHEPAFVATADKIALIDAFTEAGFPRIEATSYSHPGKVPAFGDAGDVLAGIARRPSVYYKATTPNLTGVERALADLAAGHGANEVSLLASATESHTQRNLGTSREGQWARIAEMVRAAGDRFRLVGVISVALGCPFEGEVPPERVVEDVLRFAKHGVRIVTIGDTTGLGTPVKVTRLFRLLNAAAPDVTCVGHFHDTRGVGIANCVAAYDAGCSHFDSSFGGVGGHPTKIRYGSGRAGNVATEDLVSLFEMEGVSTGLDLDKMMVASRLCEQVLGRQLDSKVARAGFATPFAEVHENA